MVLVDALDDERVSGARSFVGGMNVPLGGRGRFNATIPLARLEIGGREIRLVPRISTRWHPGAYRVAVADVLVAYPLRGRFLTAGVGIDTRAGGTASFWRITGRGEVLEALAAAGVPVDARPRSAWAAMRRRQL